jgi:hypothetical protein
MLQPKQFFHVTTQAALPSIKQHGLDNTKSETELWSNVDDWDDGAYMWDSLPKAVSYARTIRSADHRPVVLGVSGKGLDVSPDETGSTKVDGAFYAPRVPPQNVRFPKRYR